jgi:hypothetical protein
MRTLKRNGRAVTYENVIGSEPIYDAYGNDTHEKRKLYSAPVQADWNVSAAVGEEANEIFGDLTDYSRTVSLCGDCPVFEGDRVTFDGRRYKVVRIADSKNGYMIALREVADNA